MEELNSTEVYNIKNRPIRFECAGTQTVVEMNYDAQGRRFEKKITVAGTTTLHHRYIYRGFLQIACLDLTRAGTPALWFVFWDPTQSTATRPLAIQKNGTWFVYGHDLTKNVCEVFGQHGYIRTEYSYSPFGNITAVGDLEQPFQWSSEFYDSELDLVYYNYRYYSPTLGRWLSRDPIEEMGGLNLYAFVGNNPVNSYDFQGGIKIGPYQNTRLVRVSPYHNKLNGRDAHIYVKITPLSVGLKLKQRGIFGNDIFVLYARGGGFNSVTYYSENVLFEHPSNLFPQKTKLYAHEEQHYLDRKEIYETYQEMILSYNGIEICGNYCGGEYFSFNNIAGKLMEVKINLADNLFHSKPDNYYDSSNDRKEILNNIDIFSNQLKNLEQQLLKTQKLLEECISKHKK